MLNFTGDIWPRVCFDSDGGSGGGGSGSGSSSSSGKGTSAAAGYAEAAASMGAAGIGNVGGKDVGSSSTGGADGRAGGVGQEGVSGGFSSSGSSSAASGGKDTSSSASSGGRGGAVGSPGVSGGFYGAAGISAPDYSGYGGRDSPAESGPGPGAGASSSGGGRAGGVGSPGVGGGFFSPATTPQVGYGLAAQTMNEVGVGSVGGRSVDSRAMSMASAGRAAEVKSLNDLYAYDKEVVGVVGYGKGYTTVSLRDGTVETRSGDRASRNNNPGNVEFGKYAKSMGAVGTDGRFAVFSSKEQGRKAMEGLVFGPNYANKTIAEAISKYAPPHENNSTAYAASVAKAAGVTPDTKVSDLTADQRSAMISGMIGVEGNTGYKSAAVAEGKTYGTAPTGKGAASAAASPADALALPDQAPVPTSREDNLALPDQAPTPTARSSNFYAPPDEGRFAARYLSEPATSVPASVKAGFDQFGASMGKTTTMGLDGKTAPPGTVTGAYTGSTTQTTELSLAERSALDASVASYGPNAAYSGMGGKNAPGEGATGRVAPGVGPEFAATPDVGPVPESRPDDGTGVGGKVAATAIDVGLGMIPGVGVGASVVNAGLSLAGKPTIGEFAVDFLSGNGTSQGILSAAGVDTGDGGWALDLSAPPTSIPDEDKPEDEAPDFGMKYLTGSRFSDTGRPSPAEKWGRDRAGYGAREYVR